MRAFLPAILVFAGACFPPGPEAGAGELEGLVVVGGEPLRGADIDLWRLRGDGSVGERLARAESDRRGRFLLQVGTASGPFMVTAAGGVTTEFWGEGEVVYDGIELLRTAVVDHQVGERQRVVLSPFTTLAEAMARARFEQGMEDTYERAARLAHRLLSDHIRARVTHAFPSWSADEVDRWTEEDWATEPGTSDSLTANVRYALALRGLSSLAREFTEAANLSVQSWNTVALMHNLIEDISDRGVRLDGVGPEGAVEIGRCVDMPREPGEDDSGCALDANTLRVQLVRALLTEFMGSEANVLDLDMRDAGGFLQHMAENSEPLLFGGASSEPIDDQPPELRMLPSRLYDETFDRVAFGPGHVPVHIHAGPPSIDLRQGVSGATCPRVYKHVNLLHSAAEDQNPLRWRFEVVDDAVGVDEDSVKYRLGVRREGGRLQWSSEWLPAQPVEKIERGMVFEAVALRGDLPALATRKGVFEIEIWAQDWEGNRVPSPLRGCWEHVPLAAPLWAGPPQVVRGRGDALAEVGLEQNNLAPLLRGEGEPRVLFEFELINGSSDSVYVTLSMEEVAGTYSLTWLESNAVEQQEDVNIDCSSAANMDSPRCAPGGPPDPVEHEDAGDIPAGFVGIRVLDGEGTTQISCPQCEPREYSIAPRSRYTVQVVTEDWGFLLPGELPADQIAEIEFGLQDERHGLTGIANSSDEVFCYRFEVMICIHLVNYRLFQALTSLHVQANPITVGGVTRAADTTPPRKPAPAYEPEENTLSGSISMEYGWSTNEPTLPRSTDEME